MSVHCPRSVISVTLARVAVDFGGGVAHALVAVRRVSGSLGGGAMIGSGTWACERCGAEVADSAAEAHDAWHGSLVVVSRDGWRGLTLSALYVDDAAELLREWIAGHTLEYLDGWEHAAVFGFRDAYESLVCEWESCASFLRGREGCVMEDEELEWFRGMAEEAMAAIGCRTTWDDGYVIERAAEWPGA